MRQAKAWALRDGCPSLFPDEETEGVDNLGRRDGHKKFYEGRNGPSRKGQKRRQSRRKSMKGGQRGE